MKFRSEIRSLRELASDAARTALRATTPLLAPPRVIYDRDGGAPYLSRWYLTGAPTMPDGSSPWMPGGAPREGANMRSVPVAIYLHRFHRGDDDFELHNHPWRWAFSIVLAGGYREERRMSGAEFGRRADFVARRYVLPFSVNWIWGDTFHRVDLVDRDCWSLFVVGPKASSWGFWDRASGIFTPWRQHIARRRARKEAA